MTSPSITIPDPVPRYIPYRAESERERETESILDGFVFPSPPSTPSSPVMGTAFNERWMQPLSPREEQLSQPPSPGVSPYEIEKGHFPKQSLPRFYSTPLDPHDPDSTPVHLYGLEQRFECYAPRKRLGLSRPRSVVVVGGSIDETKSGATARSAAGGAGSSQGPKRFVSKKSPLSASFSIPEITGPTKDAISNGNASETTTRPASSGHLVTPSSSSSTTSLSSSSSSSTTRGETTTRATTPATTPTLKPTPAPTPDNTLKQGPYYFFSSSTLSLPIPSDYNPPTTTHTTLATYSSSTTDLNATMADTSSSAAASSSSGPKERTHSKHSRRQSILFWRGGNDDDDDNHNHNRNNADDNNNNDGYPVRVPVPVPVPPILSSPPSDNNHNNNNSIIPAKNKKYENKTTTRTTTENKKEKEKEKEKEKGRKGKESRGLIHRSLTRTFTSLRIR
jgi:hypothetical protein